MSLRVRVLQQRQWDGDSLGKARTYLLEILKLLSTALAIPRLSTLLPLLQPHRRRALTFTQSSLGSIRDGQWGTHAVLLLSDRRCELARRKDLILDLLAERQW